MIYGIYIDDDENGNKMIEYTKLKFYVETNEDVKNIREIAYIFQLKCIKSEFSCLMNKLKFDWIMTK